MLGRLKDLTINRDGSQNITITVQSDFREMFDELSEKDIDIEIKKHSKRRSMDSNNLAWALIDQIAEKMNMKKSEVYRNAIRDIGGVSAYVGVKNEALERFKRSWEANHLGRQVEVIPGSNKDGWQNVRVYFGSSEFDTAQMSRLIDSLIQDCNALGIPTMTQAEIDRSLAVWAKKVGENE